MVSTIAGYQLISNNLVVRWSTTATPSISVDQPIELGINAATLTSLQNLKIGR